MPTYSTASDPLGEALGIADAALAYNLGNPERHKHLTEAHAFAAVSAAADLRELVALKRGSFAESEGIIALDALDAETRSLVETILDPNSTALLILAPTQEGLGYDAQRVRAAALALGLEGDEEEALAAFYGSLKEGSVDPEPEMMASPSTSGSRHEAAEHFGEVFAEALAAEKKKSKKGKKS